MNRRHAARLALGSASLLPAGAARAQPVTETVLPAVADATIFAEQGGGTAYDAVADGQGASPWTSVLAAGVVRRALVRFDMSALPPGSQVLAARVEAFMIRLREPQSLALHRIDAAWSEGPANGGDAGVGAPAGAGDCTWSHRVWPNQAWASRGGDYRLSASATTPVSGWPAPVVWASTPALVNDVQGWIENPGSNHGWMMIGTESGTQNATRLGSRESSSATGRPRLVVSWLPPQADAEVPLPPWALALLGAAAAAALVRRRR
jgi:MYXO-CTERM domain-containing protein